MSKAGFLVWLHDPRLAPLALSPLPAWAWSIDAAHVVWSNPTGAAILGAATPAKLTTRRFDAGQPAAAQILNLAASLPADGTNRLEKLRGFGAGVGRALTCNCARITLANGTEVILVAAVERAGPDLPLPERVVRLLTETDTPVAAFAADGTLIAAVPAAQPWLDGARTLTALGADALIAQARAGGRAVGHSAAGTLALDCIGSEPVLLATFGEHAEALVATPAPAPETAPAPSAASLPPAATVVAPVETIPAAMPAAAEPLERRHPLRFVWQIDAENRFTLDSEEFTALAGAATRAALGRPWDELAAALALDSEGQVGRALASHDTWSGLTIAWPVDDGGASLTVELSGLPVFDRERRFRGYRGFGVCRDLARLNALAEPRAAAPAAAAPPPSPTPAAPIVAAPIVAGPADEPQPPPEPDTSALTPIEHRAFQELARRLTGRLTGQTNEDAALAKSALAELARAAAEDAAEEHAASEAQPDLFPDTAPAPAREIGILDRFPLGVLIYRLNHLIYANRAFLRWAGYESLSALAEAGGLDAVLIEQGAPGFEHGGDKPFAITGNRGAESPAEGRLFMVPWEGESAFALITSPTSPAVPAAAAPAAAAAPEPVAALAPVPDRTQELAELHAILDTATDGVVVLDRALRIASANRSAQALFGQEAEALKGQMFFDLFAPESVEAAVDYIEALHESGGVLNAGREVIGRERQGGLIPLFMTVGRLSEDSEKLCAVFRDLTPWKKAAEELIEAKRQAEKQSSAKSDFLAKISHEIRNPLNAVIGFSEVMIEERFGPISNDRYRQYLKDIHASGGHIMSLVNDLLDLSKIEAGKVELTFTQVSVNDVVQQCVALMQPQANRERIIIRSSLAPRLPQVSADARSLRQIALNLLSNSIKFTGAGGQVIVSTARTDSGEVVLRVRDTGIGMSEKELATALEPFRQVATATRASATGTGLGLPLTKALAEANRAQFRINSKPNEGTLVEVTFPTEQVMAD